MTLFPGTPRRLAVLLIGPKAFHRHTPLIVGETNVNGSDPELVDYAELLSAHNYPFDMIAVENITSQRFVDSDLIKYSSIVLAAPLSSLTETSLSLIRHASYELGLSLIVTYDHPDERSAAWFGVQRFTGKRILTSLKADIIRWPHDNGPACVVDYGPRSAFLGIRRRGLRRLSWRTTAAKSLKLIRSLIVPYVRADRAPGAQVLATTRRGEALAWSYQFGNATNYYFALRGDLFLDKYNEMHRLVRCVIEANSGNGMASIDLDRTMVLRLDDPGASKADYLFDGQVLHQEEWEQLGRILEEYQVPLSVMYTPAWVDDGDARSGSLFVDDQHITDRIVGRLYESARVRYVRGDRQKTVHDHVSEFKGLEALVNRRFVDVHSHGLTHLVPRYEAWAAAKNKRSDVRWYTEFMDSRKTEPVGEEAQMEAMIASKESIENLFNTMPAAITPSGHKHDASCDMMAHATGYTLFSSDYTAIMKPERIVRNWKMPSIFLCFKDPSSAIAKAGYPIIGVVHDYEIKDCLDRLRILIERWSAAGIRRFTSLSTLAVSLCSSIDVVYSEQDCNVTVSIDMPAYVQRGGCAVWGATPEIFVRVVFPWGLCCQEERITVDGGLLVSSEWTAHSSVSLAIKVVDQRSVKVVLPLNVCELTPDAETRLRGNTVAGSPRHHVVGTGRV